MSLFPNDSSQTIYAHCDGGSRGNPGPSGYGAVITDENGNKIAELSEFLGIRTNNYAEYSGLLAVLAYAVENKHQSLKVVSDSELMVKQIQGKYKVNSPDLKPLWQEARDRFQRSNPLKSATRCATRTKTPTLSPIKPWTADRSAPPLLSPPRSSRSLSALSL
jgi:ribonuclease HI